jgi:hypothetical protein
MHQPGIRREADRFLLHGGIHNDLGEVGRPGCTHADGGCEAFLNQHRQLRFAHALPPPRQ